MTITDMAGLEALPDSFAFVDSMGDIGVMLGGQAWYPETATMGAERAVRKYGPLEVLSPRTVTPEQVKAGARAVDDLPWDGQHGGSDPDATEIVTAALAAMGVGVSDG